MQPSDASPLSESLKLMLASLRLTKAFTAKELAAEAQVNISTARFWLSSRQSLLRAGKRPKPRGAPEKTYQLKPSKRNEVRSVAQNLWMQLSRLELGGRSQQIPDDMPDFDNLPELQSAGAFVAESMVRFADACDGELFKTFAGRRDLRRRWMQVCQGNEELEFAKVFDARRAAAADLNRIEAMLTYWRNRGAGAHISPRAIAAVRSIAAGFRDPGVFVVGGAVCVILRAANPAISIKELSSLLLDEAKSATDTALQGLGEAPSGRLIGGMTLPEPIQQMALRLAYALLQRYDLCQSIHKKTADTISPIFSVGLLHALCKNAALPTADSGSASSSVARCLLTAAGWRGWDAMTSGIADFRYEFSKFSAASDEAAALVAHIVAGVGTHNSLRKNTVLRNEVRLLRDTRLWRPCFNALYPNLVIDDPTVDRVAVIKGLEPRHLIELGNLGLSPSIIAGLEVSDQSKSIPVIEFDLSKLGINASDSSVISNATMRTYATAA